MASALGGLLAASSIGSSVLKSALSGITSGASSASRALTTAQQNAFNAGAGPVSSSYAPTALTKLSSGVSSIGTQGSGSSASTASSASSQYSLDSLMSSVQQIAGQNTQLSAEQAEQLRKWQEIQNQKVMDFNSFEAAKSRDWQKMMSDTAHQREVADLQAAGLNPVLSAMGGNGASVTSGAQASGLTPSGAQGQVDQSATAGFVQMLGSLLSAQTALIDRAMSARSNEAIADRQNATSHLVAMLTGQYGLARERLSGEYGLKRQYESDVWANWRTQQTAAASMYAADQSRAASKYFADTQYNIHRDFPNTGIAAIASVLERFLGSSGSSAVGSLVDKGVTSLGDFFGLNKVSDKEKSQLADIIGWDKVNRLFSGDKSGFNNARANEVFDSLFGWLNKYDK